MKKHSKTKKTECEKCKWKDDCVNVGEFLDEDCLAYEEATGLHPAPVP